MTSFMAFQVIYIGTIIWVFIDARTHKFTVNKKPYSVNNGAIAWGLTQLVLWPIAYPYYLYRRTKDLNAQSPQGNHARTAALLMIPWVIGLPILVVHWMTGN